MYKNWAHSIYHITGKYNTMETEILLVILLACTGCKITKKNQNWEYLTSRKKICQ